MKKLLILGGNTLSVDLVLAAKKKGIYTIVMDWYDIDKSPAKLCADEYSMLSIADIDGVVRFIKDNDISGVITGYTDSYLTFYIDICAKAGLPCYLTKENLILTLDKRIFKETCKKYNIGIIPEYNLKEITDCNAFFSDKYPILFKPVDNSGSRGIVICFNEKDFKNAYAESLSFSKKGDVLIEKFMNCDDVSLAYTMRNGEIHLSVVCDRYIKQTLNGGSVTSGLIYPSKYIDRFIKEKDNDVKRMLRDWMFENGVVFLQAFVDENDFYFYEMGYRLSGGRHYLFTKNQNNVSAAEMLINFAITGDMGEEIERENPYFHQQCCQLSVLCDNDTVAKISGIEEIERWPEVINWSLYYKEGDKIGAEGTSAQIFARIHFVADDYAQIKSTLKKIRSVLRVENGQGKNIVQDFFWE